MSNFFPHFQEFLLSRVLEQKFCNERSTAKFVDFLLDSDPTQLPMEHVNLCARVPSQLVRELETRISYLGMSKRQFIEFSIHHALNMADELIQQHSLEVNDEV